MGTPRGRRRRRPCFRGSRCPHKRREIGRLVAFRAPKATRGPISRGEPGPGHAATPFPRGERGRGAVSTRRAPEGTRTPNLLIRSQMLYPLSYGRMVVLFGCGARRLRDLNAVWRLTQAALAVRRYIPD